MWQIKKGVQRVRCGSGQSLANAAVAVQANDRRDKFLSDKADEAGIGYFYFEPVPLFSTMLNSVSSSTS